MFLTLLPYLTVAANLALVLGILLGLNQRVRELRARTGKQEKTLETENARLSAEVTDLKARVLELEQIGNSLPSTTASSGKPASRRTTTRPLRFDTGPTAASANRRTFPPAVRATAYGGGGTPGAPSWPLLYCAPGAPMLYAVGALSASAGGPCGRQPARRMPSPVLARTGCAAH